ncbi:MAG: hypothetical protein U0359_19265 [Byssovorax sp.]
MLDDAHLALMPSASLRDELDEIATKDARISKLVFGRGGAPDSSAIVTLPDRKGNVTFQMVEVPVPGVAGNLYAGQLPGRATPVAGELDALVAFGVRHVFGLLPRIDLDDLYRVPKYVEEAQARFGDRFRLLDVIDYEVPPDDAALDDAVRAAESALVAGDKVYVHCGAGCGRAGLFIGCLLARRGEDPVSAMIRYRAIRGCGVETPSQAAYVVRYAAGLAAST